LNPITIYCDHFSDRLRYACHILFEVVLKVPYSLASNSSDNNRSENLPCILYSAYKSETSTDAFQIVPKELLFNTGIETMEVPIVWRDNIPLLFADTDNEYNALGFDIFAAVFYMVTRYEEYLPFLPDKFGRFPEALSLSGRHDFTHLPVVHYWGMFLWERLQNKWPDLRKPDPIPSAIFTYDIDVAYAYKGRTPGRHALSLAKDVFSFDFQNLKSKFKTRWGNHEDPSDTYHEISSHAIPRIFFFLLAGNKSRFDRNLAPSSQELHYLIKKIYKKEGVPGIHPSFYSSEKPKLIHDEKKTLESIINHSVTKSRQHFLKFKTPDTFRALIHAGIEEDYSMQYPEMPGFRAGICLPYHWFDVERNEVTPLMIYPGCIMETTFRDDLFIPAPLTTDWYQRTWESVKKVGGCFISIWHNDSLQTNIDKNNSLAFIYLHRFMAKLIENDLGLEKP
jgi:hypothetical protein